MDPKPVGPPTSGDDELARRRQRRARTSPTTTRAGDGAVVELAPYRAARTGTCACGRVHPSCAGYAGLGLETDRISERLRALERLQAMLSAE